MNNAQPYCPLCSPPIDFRNFISQVIGVDNSFDACGEAKIDICKGCGKIWLHYFTEIDLHTATGVWLRGEITKEESENVRAETATNLLDKKDFILTGESKYGGVTVERDGAYISKVIKYYKNLKRIRKL